MTYSITFYRTFNPILGLFLNKLCRKVKINTFANGMPSNTYMLVVYSDESRELIDISKFVGYKLSTNFFLLQAQNIKKETNGGTDLTDLPKEQKGE